MTDVRLRIPAHVAYRELVRETVVFDLQTGAYRSFPPQAGRVLALIEQCGSIEQSAAQMASETGRSLDSVRRSVAAYCLQLTRAGLLEIDSRSPAPKRSSRPSQVA